MIFNTYPGKLICLEGLDGCGKSIQARYLFDCLANDYKLSLILTSEPTRNGPIGIEINRILKKEIPCPDHAELQKMFSLDRSWHNQNIIIPALERGCRVLTDRYFPSTYAYGRAFEVPREDLEKWNEDAVEPSLTLILKVRPETCLARLQKTRGDQEFFERFHVLRRVDMYYKEYQRNHPSVYFVDGEREKRDVHFEIIDKVKEFFEWSDL